MFILQVNAFPYNTPNATLTSYINVRQVISQYD